MNEYLCLIPGTDSLAITDQSHANPWSEVRCPRGDRICDAQNLGWLMKRLGELGMLPAILQSSTLPCLTPPKTQSLLDMINSLSLITSPPQRHGGICDFTPAFRAAIRDIYESVTGLTLSDVSGKSGGWALSKNRSSRHSAQSQINGGACEQLFKIAQQRYATEEDRRHHRHYHHHDYRRSPILLLGASGGNDGDYHDRDRDRDRDDVCLFKILSLLDDPRDLRAAAMINRRFYWSYRRNRTRLREGIREAGTESMAAPLCRQAYIAEVDGTPYGARASAHGGDSAESGVAVAVSPREKFKFGQIFLVEDKRLVEDDAGKYVGYIQAPLSLGLRVDGKV